MSNNKIVSEAAAVTMIPPAFETERLRVFHVMLSPTDRNTRRHVFLGCRQDEDRPMIAVSAMVESRRWSPRGLWVDWIETTSAYRRMGFGRELLRGIQKYLDDPLKYSGVTNEGAAFCDAMEAEERAARTGAPSTSRPADACEDPP
jgi:hypothetical protein